jgi:acyl carrier protein
MEDKIKQIFRELFKVKPEDFNDCLDVNTVAGWDSMNHLNLVIALEESFGVSLTTEEVIQMTSVKAIVEILNRRNEKI